MNLMSKPARILVFYGGVGSERAVSLESGKAISAVLAKHFLVEEVELKSAELPDSLSFEDAIVFPALHGTFGEDGTLQAALEARGVIFSGSDAQSSRLCMAKETAKKVARELSIPTPDSLYFNANETPLADTVIEQLGSSLVVKPSNMGSSVGLHFTEHRSELGVALSQIHAGEWLIEKRIQGRELTVGVLEGSALEVVEVVSASGVYDYAAKYASTANKYYCPAEIEPSLRAQICEYAEALFKACGCRDFARVDFLLDETRPYFLEVNTLPGLTASSLLPKSASARGYDFEGLALALVQGAFNRYEKGHSH